MRLALALPFVLIACQAADYPAPRPGNDTCPAPELQHYLGEPEAAAAGIDYAGPVRVILPGMAVTEDYSASRLNIDIGLDGRIARLWCG